MKRYIILLAGAAMLSGCNQTLKSEPSPGTLTFGTKLLVDDGTCPAGQIKQITGGHGSKVRRQRKCIAKP
ncbi:lipoprotein [Mesorhizobium sp. AR07]|uniref:DUF6719 family protein n=1 Tax=Mesorhizobium sp. AR07 TaxID=2865838 RepID=UPI00215E007D|nr:DUF6719 family protein [Mesorhizobium sp. AR07]UVK42342.1 lipoprotein [Mesorhizobium sp. AR07]